MRVFPQHRILALAAALAVAPAALAQSGPHIGYVYPAGGRVGTAVDVVVGGQNLRGVAGALVSGAGVSAEVTEYSRPLTQKQLNDLRQEASELQKRRNAAQRFRTRQRGRRNAETPPELTWTPEDQKKLASIRARIADRFRRRAIPAIAETAVVRVTIAADAGTGLRELRLRTPAGASNPLVFCVGQLPEVTEKEPKIWARSQPGTRRAQAPTRPIATETVSLPTVVNGQIMPGDVDRFRFHARAGQRLVVAASARRLIPYLADAVPGWFQATLALRDAQGVELAYVDDYRFDPDPVLLHEIPADGDYVVEIRDAIYRGREDFVYRIALGELPFIASVFPLGGEAGAPTRVEVSGWNLPAPELTVAADGDGSSVVVRANGAVSNAVPFMRDTLGERLEREPDDSPETAQPIALGHVVNGRIDRPGDRDVFRFRGRRGQEIVAEVYARRLRSPLDSVLRLTDARGQQLAYNDDHVDPGAGLTTHHADSWLRVTLPANGTYDLHLGDAQGHGGAEYAYRLRVGPPRPDFELRIVPSSVNARAGQTVPLTVHAVRKDGFSGAIDLRLLDAPEGFALGGARVPAGQDRIRLTLTAPKAPLADPIGLRLEGRAKVDGRDIVRPVVPAEDMMQAFLYRHLVPAAELVVSLTGRGQAIPLRLATEQPVEIRAGRTARVRLAGPRRRRGRRAGNPIQLELSDPPAGVTIESVTPWRTGLEVVLRANADTVEADATGNLIVRVFSVPAAPPPADAAPQRRARRRLLGTLPAIPFELVAKRGGGDGHD